MKVRYFFAISFVALIAAVGCLIYYQRTANAKATQVEQLDVAASPEAVTATAELKRYVESHMGVSATVQLQGSQQRAEAAANAAASQPGSEVYAQAQAACAKSGDSIAQSKCVTAYIGSHSAPAANPQPVAMPDPAQFSQSFHGSNWTMDGTGIALLISVLAAGWGLFTLARRGSRSKHQHPDQVYRGPRSHQL